MAHVFLSYAHAQLDVAELLVAVLRDRGIEVWFDRDIEAGREWSPAIQQEIESATCAVVLWSKEARASTWVWKEARFADRASKLIPVVLDGAPPPIEFDHLQAVDLTDWNGDREHSDLASLLRAVAAKVAAPTPREPDVKNPLRLLDISSPGVRVAGAPSLGEIERELRTSPVRRRRRLMLLSPLVGISLLAAGVAGRALSAPSWIWVTLTILGIACVIASILPFMAAMESAPPTVDLRGRRVPGDGETDVPRSDAVAAPNAPPLLFVTEAVDHRLTEDNDWELTILFTLFNRGDEELVVFDAHANVYALESEELKPAVIGYRETLSIYETNSILRSGRRVVIAPRSSDALRLRVRVSRTVAIEGMEETDSRDKRTIFALFGIFVDVHAPEDGAIVDYRFPSDAVYCFIADSESFQAITRANLREWAERHSRPETARKLVLLLRAHRESVSRIMPHVERALERYQLALVGYLALALNVILFCAFYGAVIVSLAAFLFQRSVAIGADRPVQVIRFSRAAEIQICTIAEEIKALLAKPCPKSALAEFFCDDRYTQPTRGWWRAVAAPRDEDLPPWLPPAKRRALLTAHLDGGYRLASAAALLIPRPLVSREKAGWIVRVLAVAYAAFMIMLVLPRHARGVRALAYEVMTGGRDESAGWGNLILGVIAAPAAYFLGPSLTPMVVASPFVIITVIMTTCFYRMKDH